MKLSRFRAAALLAAIYAAPTFAQPAPAPAAAQPKIEVSRGAAKAVVDLQTAVNANDSASYAAKLAAAEAAATTPADHYVIAKLQLKIALAAKDNEGMLKAIDALAGTGLVATSELAGAYSGVGVEFYNAKDYARAAELFQRASALDPSNVEAQGLVAEAQNALGQKAEAAATMQKVIKQTLASGKKPDEKAYKEALAFAFAAKSPDVMSVAQQWLTAYPSPGSWTDTVALYRNSVQPSASETLDLLRLLRAAGALSRPAEYSDYIRIASDQNNFAEAQAILDEAIAARQIEDGTPLAANVRAKPRPSLEDLAAAAKTAPSARTLIGIGDRYYGLGEYAKAADTYRQALAKGGDASLANLHLGMALARAGDKAGALTAFNATTGANAGIARLWTLYLNMKS